jgi:hypothetical protein
MNNKNTDVEERDDDTIIAEALVQIRTGVENGNWQDVCDAYNSITGEDLSIPVKKKSRLDNIRTLMDKNNKMTKAKNAPKAKVVKTKGKKPTTEVGDADTGDIVIEQIGNVQIISSIEDPSEKQANAKADKRAAATKKLISRPPDIGEEPLVKGGVINVRDRK